MRRAGLRFGMAALVGICAVAMDDRAVRSAGPQSTAMETAEPRSANDAARPLASTPPPAQASSSSSQDLQDRPLFRGGTAFVYVDVYPRRDGRPIEGLTAPDFEVFEDGRAQQVELFEFIRHETAIVDADRRDPNSQADGERQAADPRNRVFVIYLDSYSIPFENARDTQSAVMGFLQRAIGPTDLFGVMTPELPVSQLVFGRRFETIEGDLAGLWRETVDRVGPRTPAEEKLMTCVPEPDKRRGVDHIGLLFREDMLATSLENLMRRLGGLRDERKNVLFISEGWVPTPARSVQGMANRGTGDIPVIGVGPTGRLGIGNQQPHGRDNDWCDQQRARLESQDFEQRFRGLLELARRSNVTFYPIDVAGLRVRSNERARQTLLTLAENTDGAAITNTNDTTGAARRLADSLSAYYLLGYYSSNAATDGRYREIEVKIRQPRVDVSARPGYFAPTPEILAAASAPRSTTPSAVDRELVRLARTRPDAALFTHGVSRPGGLRVVAELGSRLVNGGGGWSDGADVHVAVHREGGEPATATGRIEPGARATTVEVPASAIGAGPWRVEMEVTAATARRGRSVRGGAAGDARLESSLEVAAPAGQLLGDPMAFRANPSPRSPVKPVADFLYRRTERLHVEWPALQALDAHEARLLDRAGTPLPLAPTVSARANEGRYLLAIDLSLSALGEGDYVLELTGKTGETSDRRLLAFRVIR